MSFKDVEYYRPSSFQINNLRLLLLSIYEFDQLVIAHFVFYVNHHIQAYLNEWYF